MTTARIKARQATTGRDTSIRVHARAYDQLRASAALEDKPLTQFMDEVAEREERRAFWQQFNAAVERLRADPQAWAAYQAESRELEGTLMDGIDPGEEWRDVFNTEAAPW